MNNKTFEVQLKTAQKQQIESKKDSYIHKIHNEDKKVITNFHMIKLSDILQIKESIRVLESSVQSCNKQLLKLN